MAANLVIKFLLEKKFPQDRLYNHGDFINLAKNYGLPVSALSDQDFEFWDRFGLLRPIIKVRSIASKHLVKGHQPHAIQYDLEPLNRRPRKGEKVITIYHHWYLEPYLLKDLQTDGKNRIIDPYSRYFQKWSRFKDTSHQTRVTYWYHPFQIIRLREILRMCELDVLFSQFRVYPIEKTIKKFYKGFKRVKKRLQASEAQSYKHLSLIVAIEDRFLPEIRDHIAFRGLDRNWDNWAASFSGHSILKRIGMSLEDVRGWRNDLAWEWHQLNDLGDWHLLVRHAEHDSKRQLKGKPKLAWQYYEYTELLRLFLQHLTGKEQPSVEQITSVGAHIPQTAAPKRKGKAIVPVLLRRFRLDPRFKVLFAVEGETEIAFVSTWCEQHSLDLRGSGVELVNLHTVNSLRSPWLTDRLKAAAENDARVIIIVDDENNAAKALDGLEKKKLIEGIHDIKMLNDPHAFPVGAFIWKPCFEDANFTLEELVTAWVTTIANRDHPNSIVPSEQTLIENARARHSACGTWIKSLERISGKRWPLNKPEIGAELARRIKTESPPVIKLIRKVMVLANSLV